MNNNEDTKQEEGEEMFKYVLSMILFGGLLGGGLIGGCGEESTETGGDGEEGTGMPEECRVTSLELWGDFDGDSWISIACGGDDCDDDNKAVNPGFSEVGSDGIDNDCDGVVDDVPPGAENEQCGKGGSCHEPFECLPCEEVGQYSGTDGYSSSNYNTCWRSTGYNEEGFSVGVKTPGPKICTCPQWFEGRWWAEFEPRAVDREFDFTLGRERERWSARELEITQEGCVVRGPSEVTTVLIGEGKANPPRGFWFQAHRGSVEGERRPIVFTGTLSEDRHTITGTCEGEYPDGTVEPTVWFRITCEFTLTRR